MNLPLQILFHFDSASLKSWNGQPGRYRETLRHYHALLRIPWGGYSGQPETAWHKLARAHAYLQVTDDDRPLLPDVIDELLDCDVKPFAQDGTQVRERNSTHQLYSIDRSELLRVPYTLLVKGDVRVQPQGSEPLLQILTNAVETLHVNHQVVSVGFSPGFSFLPAQRASETYDVAQTLRWPAVVRTRDLYLAAFLGLRSGPAEAEQVLTAFSYNPARHLAFNSTIARTV